MCKRKYDTLSQRNTLRDPKELYLLPSWMDLKTIYRVKSMGYEREELCTDPLSSEIGEPNPVWQKSEYQLPTEEER